MKSVLLLQETLPFHGGVPRKFLCLAQQLPQGKDFHFGSLYDSADSILPRLGEAGHPVVDFKSNNLALLAWRVRSYLQRQGIAAILAFSFRSWCVAKAATVGLPCRVAACVCDFSLMRKPLKHALFRLMSHRDWIVANSRAMLKAHAVPGRPRAVLLYNGIAPLPAVGREQARAALGIPPEVTLLLYAADCQPYKDHATLLRAFGMLANRHPALGLALCGRSGGLAQEIADCLGADSSVARRVMLLGPRDDMECCLAAADLYVHPCYEEGFGNAAAEAMLAGVPVIVADQGGLPEVVGDAGLIFEARNPDALARAIESLLNDPERRRVLAARGHARVRSFFDVGSFTQNFLIICQRILDETEGSPSAFRQTLPRRLKFAARDAAAATLLPLAWLSRRKGSAVAILSYHRVLPDFPVGSPRSAVVAPRDFAAQMNWLREHGYVTLTLEEFRRIAYGQMQAPPCSALVTFDDGYADNARIAMEIGLQCQVRLNFFLPTGIIGLPEWPFYWDARSPQETWHIQRHPELWRPLSWDETLAMREAGASFGGHGYRHLRLATLDDETLELEITCGLEAFAQYLGEPARHFSIPWGDATAYDDRALSLLRAHGIDCIYTTRPVLARVPDSKGVFPRISIREHDGLAAFARKVQGAHDLLRAALSPLGASA